MSRVHNRTMPVLSIPGESVLVPVAHMRWHQYLNWATEDLLGRIAEEGCGSRIPQDDPPGIHIAHDDGIADYPKQLPSAYVLWPHQ